MPDTIGRITVPEATATLTFPLRTKYPHGRAQARPIIAHTFGGDGKAEQRFFVGPGAIRYTFRVDNINRTQRAALRTFWQGLKGSEGAFFYDAPQEDQTFVTKTVCFAAEPLTFEEFSNALTAVGLTFVEIPNPEAAPTYELSGTVTRFPSSGIADALLAQAQEIIPLVRIRVKEVAVDDIFLADRRCTIGEQLYLPRLLRIGDPGSDVLMAQSIDGETDQVQFTFGNSDRVMRDLAADTQLMGARVELSLYHVASQSKLDLWAGDVVDWANDYGPEFTLSASDPLSALTLQSPAGTAARHCWRRYSLDGCPADPETDTRDLVHFPSADMATCDLGYDTANGCLAHSGGTGADIKRSFGGVVGSPQSAGKINNTSTGTWGMWQKTFAPSSQINDSAWGEPLAEIWHHDDGDVKKALPVACRIVSGREESDFYQALGIVGRGPIGEFTTPSMYDSDGDSTADKFVGHTLDGQPHHGFKANDDGSYSDTSGGLHVITGDDPAGATDFFSLDRSGTSTSNWRETVSGASVYEDTFAAGVAALVIRRTDEKGIQLTTPQSHAMEAMISKGLTGWKWAGTTRSSEAGMTNPFWVAVNTLLRAFGVNGSDSATQLGYFDVTAAETAAAQADTTVPKILGTGTEKQFRFKGVVRDRKPTRDWLRDILNNGLGYYTWSFGKLRLGCRNSGTGTTTFNAGNMLFGSLKVSPVKPAFEKTFVTFADEDFRFAQNTIDYTDQDYAALHGRVQNPRAQTIGLVGCATKSQAMRIAITRTREELGGATLAEITKARNVSWRSTILALDTEAGQVVRINDRELPGGGGYFRILRWQLNRDWSVEFTGRTVTPSMYSVASITMGAPQLPPVIVTPPKDTAPPDAPTFLVRKSPTDPQSIEVYSLSVPQANNNRSITSGTFTIHYTDPASAAQTLALTSNFSPGFFQSAALAEWTLKRSLPGCTVTAVDGYLTNGYGNSDEYTVTCSIALSSGIVVNPDDTITDSGGNPVLTSKEKVVFGIGGTGAVAAGENLTNWHHPVLRAGSPIAGAITIPAGMGGGACTLDILKSSDGSTWTSIMDSSKIVIPNAFTGRMSFSNFADSISTNDVLRIDCTAVTGTGPQYVYVAVTY